MSQFLSQIVSLLSTYVFETVEGRDYLTVDHGVLLTVVNLGDGPSHV